MKNEQNRAYIRYRLYGSQYSDISNENLENTLKVKNIYLSQRQKLLLSCIQIEINQGLIYTYIKHGYSILKKLLIIILSMIIYNKLFYHTILRQKQRKRKKIHQ